jgi:hypothetical protein
MKRAEFNEETIESLLRGYRPAGPEAALRRRVMERRERPETPAPRWRAWGRYSIAASLAVGTLLGWSGNHRAKATLDNLRVADRQWATQRMVQATRDLPEARPLIPVLVAVDEQRRASGAATRTMMESSL